jgi:hypothetical protein
MFCEGCNGPVVRMGGQDSISIFVSLSHKSHAMKRKSISRGVPVRNKKRFFILKSPREDGQRAGL